MKESQFVSPTRQEGYKLEPIAYHHASTFGAVRNKLPFRNNAVDVFYSHHVIEHLPDSSLPFHFREMYRCLKGEGIIRVGTRRAAIYWRTTMTVPRVSRFPGLA